MRFGQPSKDVCYIIPEMFPFTDTHTDRPRDRVPRAPCWRPWSGGATVPKIMFTNTSAEYWRGDAALIHTDLETLTDAPESPSVRRYHFAGCQHGSGDFPPLEFRASDGIQRATPLQQRGLRTPAAGRAGQPGPLGHHRRGTSGQPPPQPGRRHGGGVAHAAGAVCPTPRRARCPAQTTRAIRLDYGPESHLGRTTKLPADEGAGIPGAGGRSWTSPSTSGGASACRTCQSR